MLKRPKKVTPVTTDWERRKLINIGKQEYKAQSNGQLVLVLQYFLIFLAVTALVLSAWNWIRVNKQHADTVERLSDFLIGDINGVSPGNEEKRKRKHVFEAKLAPFGGIDLLGGPGIFIVPQPSTSSITLQVDPRDSQTRISNSCPPGLFVTSILQNGTMVCDSLVNFGEANTASNLIGSGGVGLF